MKEIRDVSLQSEGSFFHRHWKTLATLATFIAAAKLTFDAADELKKDAGEKLRESTEAYIRDKFYMNVFIVFFQVLVLVGLGFFLEYSSKSLFNDLLGFSVVSIIISFNVIHFFFSTIPSIIRTNEFLKSYANYSMLLIFQVSVWQILCKLDILFATAIIVLGFFFRMFLAQQPSISSAFFRGLQFVLYN